NRVHTHERAGQSWSEYDRLTTTSSLCLVACQYPKARQVFFKGTSSTEVDGVSTSGVDFWHAVEFSRNGRFLRTHPLGLSSGLSFCCLAFPTLPDHFRTVSGFGFEFGDRWGSLPFGFHHVSAFPL
ncbi:hypothetical protein, partial [Streptomyces erythrochromogenes]|uniref:hypothetical protein n=1 Tax=Streptomyces erythrochromogenes TaxID=285574 RepID=UPI0036CB9C59